MTKQPLDLFWFLPTSGDGSYLGTEKGHRPADIGYLRDIAQAADRLGFGGVLLPTGTNCLDGWMVGSALAPQTERLKFLLALRPGFLTPGLAARIFTGAALPEGADVVIMQEDCERDGHEDIAAEVEGRDYDHRKDRYGDLRQQCKKLVRSSC